MDILCLDERSRIAEPFGVRRLPETLIYDPAGSMVLQARAPMSWSDTRHQAQIEQIKGGVEEIHRMFSSGPSAVFEICRRNRPHRA